MGITLQIQSDWLSARDLHLPSYPAFFLPDPESDIPACREVRFGLRSQFPEVLPLKERSQSFQLFPKRLVVGILQKRRCGRIVPALRLCLDAGVYGWGE
jgi:hypothetical protein